MKNSFEYTGINNSPTTVVQAGAELKDAKAKAVKYDATGLAVYPAVGEMPVGIVLVNEDESIVPFDDITIQIKDIGIWQAGQAVAVGDLLTSDAAGCCQKAATGQYIFARALNFAMAAGDLVTVQIIHAGYAI